MWQDTPTGDTTTQSAWENANTAQNKTIWCTHSVICFVGL